MRFIDRYSHSKPAYLSSAEMDEANYELIQYVTDEIGLSNQRRVPYDSSLLIHPSLQAALFDLFGHHCVYCERSDEDYIISLHHHRPNTLARSADGETSLLYYSWLGYDWENLVQCCSVCERRKQNQFPVDGERGRLLSSVSELRAEEQALLLDPCYDIPHQHLQYFADGAVHGVTTRGERSIETLKLNHVSLVEGRSRAFEVLLGDLLSGEFVDQSYVQTGCPDSWSAYALTGRKFAGSTTLALLQSFYLIGAKFVDIVGLISFLSELSKTERQSVLSKIRDLIGGLQREPSLDVADWLWGEFEPALSRQNATNSIVDFHSVADHQFRKIDSQPQGPSARQQKLENLQYAEKDVTSFRIKNYKALRDVSLELPSRELLGNQSGTGAASSPCMIVLGENATGKSSILEAIALSLIGSRQTNSLNRAMKDFDVSPKTLIHRPDPSNWAEKADNCIEVEVEFEDLSSTTQLLGEPKSSAFQGGQTPSKIVLGYGPRRFFKKGKKRWNATPGRLVRSLFDPMDTMSDPLIWLLECDAKDFDAAVRVLRVLVFLDDDDEGYFLRGEENIYLNVAGRELPFDQLSMGFKSVISLAVDITRELLRYYDNIEYAHAVVLLDEIETHLHPRWKMQLMRRLRLAFPCVQFIATTHDPLCLRGMNDGEVFVLQRDPVRHSVDLVSELPSIKGMRADQLLTSEFFGLGSTDPETDAKLIKYHYLVSQPGDEAKIQAMELRKELGVMRIGNSFIERQVASALSFEEFETLQNLPALEGFKKKEALAKVLSSLSLPDGNSLPKEDGE